MKDREFVFRRKNDYKINDIKYDEKDFNADDYKVQIAFLFVDKVLDKDL